MQQKHLTKANTPHDKNYHQTGNRRKPPQTGKMYLQKTYSTTILKIKYEILFP